MIVLRDYYIFKATKVKRLKAEMFEPNQTGSDMSDLSNIDNDVSELLRDSFGDPGGSELELDKNLNDILEDLKKSNERLWFNTSLRMGGIYMDTNDMKNLNDMLLLLKTACKKVDAVSDDLLDVDVYDMSKGNHLLEVFALEI